MQSGYKRPRVLRDGKESDIGPKNNAQWIGWTLLSLMVCLTFVAVVFICYALDVDWEISELQPTGPQLQAAQWGVRGYLSSCIACAASSLAIGAWVMWSGYEIRRDHNYFSFAFIMLTFASLDVVVVWISLLGVLWI